MTYAVKSVFLTIQGEGARAGTKAMFVRLAGCNLWSGRPEDRDKGKGACAKWCDTNFVGGEKLSALELADRMDALWLGGDDERWCVLTGGEPALQLDLGLVRELQRRAWRIAMETNGTVDSDAVQAVDWLTVSPKLGGALKVRGGSELKVVLPGAVDQAQGWTDVQLLELASSRLWRYKFVQPMDPLNSAAVEDTYLHPARGLLGASGTAVGQAYDFGLARCLAFVQKHPDWRLGAQLHKLWKLP